MSLWRALAPAKINLGLFVGPVRSDGRHEIVSVMQSISLADELTLTCPVAGLAEDELHCPGVDGPAADNLAMRALAAFRRQSGWAAPPMRLTVGKRVPVAAGLGGGSGDAAATLRLAASASGVGEQAMLERIARTLGADVPAQVQPGRWLATGAGELLQALPRARRPLGVLVLPLQVKLATAEVYAAYDQLGRARDAAQLRRFAEQLASAFESGAALPGADLLHNDLQQAACRLCPAIEEALVEARESGADVAVLSGSGPTVLGLFAGEQAPARAIEAARRCRGRIPAAIAATDVDASYGAPSASQ